MLHPKNVKVMKKKPLLFLIVFMGLVVVCEKSTEPETIGSISAMVRHVVDDSPVYPSFIFCDDTLVTHTKADGTFQLHPLEQGIYTLTCSALSFRDTTLQVQVNGGQTTRPVFYMTPDSSTGSLRVEFQDDALFQQQIIENPDLLNWSMQDIFDGVTGATLQSKTLRMHLPPRMIYIGDTFVAVTDEFAQSWFDLQSGTYPFVGKCDGYQDAHAVVRVQAGEKVYVAFLMKKGETALQ